jgi:hypothetical protein
VKIVVAGGSRFCVDFTAAFCTAGGAPVPGFGSNPAMEPVAS